MNGLVGPSQEARRDLIGIGLGCALLFLAWSGARDLWNPNEPLYGQAVVEMSESGNWVVPTVHGQPFAEKPILYYWLALIAAKIFGGVHEFSLRLPSALAGLSMVLWTYLLVAPYAGHRRARLTAAVLATTFVVFWSARQIQMDLLLAACTVATLLPLTRMVDHGANRKAMWLLAGVAAGTGFLAKGPVGLICPGLPFLSYLVLTRRTRLILDPALLLGVFGCLMTAVPWYAALAREGGVAALVEMLHRQNFVRFVDAWDHQRPWWYYLLYFWIDLTPWALFVPLAWGLAPSDRNERRLHRFCWLWIATLVFFFSLSASKRSVYILPAVPAAAILVGAVADRWWSGALSARRLLFGRLLCGGFGLLFAMAGAALWWRSDSLPETAVELQGVAPWLAGLLLAAGSAILGTLAFSRRRFAVVAVFFAVVVSIYLVGAGLLPRANSFKSQRELYAEINLHAPASSPLSGYRLWVHGATYTPYSGRPVPNLETPDELGEYWDSQAPAYLIVERGRLEEIRSILGAAAPLTIRAVGSKRIYLFANPAGEAASDSGARDRAPGQVDQRTE